LSSFFPHAEREYTTKEIEMTSNYSHKRVYTTLMKLAERSYLIKRKVGKAYVFKFNLAKDLFLHYLYFQTEKYDKFLLKTWFPV
jgi:hypothetical protein